MARVTRKAVEDIATQDENVKVEQAAERDQPMDVDQEILSVVKAEPATAVAISSTSG